jgi:ribosomal protein S18 acetylase RimI-like enzyme
MSNVTLHPIKLHRLERVIDGERYTVISAMLRGEFVGTVEVQCVHERAHIYFLFVAPAARRRGVATKLLEDCCAVAKRSGCKDVQLACSKTNKAALSLYLKRGFEMRGTSQLIGGPVLRRSLL